MLLNRHLATTGIFAGLLTLSACQGPDAEAPVPRPFDAPTTPAANDPAPTKPVMFRIADTLRPSRDFLEPMADGGERPVGVLAHGDGRPEEFVENEVILRPRSKEELDAFLARYNGVVLRDGTLAPPANVTVLESYEPSGYYLIRIDLRTLETDDLDQNLIALGANGRVEISSADAARLAALVLRERSALEVSPNFVMTPTSVDEHPSTQISHFNAETWRWMSESSTGYSVGVIHAWEYLKYHGIPATPDENGMATQDLQRVAIIDRGFALDATTGRPLNDNPDFFYFGDEGPFQYDFSQGTNRAGGDDKYDGVITEIAEEIAELLGHEHSKWHGTKAFGVCCALQDNRFGTAGTGAPVTVPVLLRAALDLYAISDAIRYAAIWYGADVISISLSHNCSFDGGLLCSVADGGMMQNAVYTALAFDSVVVSGAGNDGDDVSDSNVIPCKLDGVICVGSVYQEGAFDDIELRYNYGDGVDIWAPTCIHTTVTPNQAALDDNDFGEDEIGEFCGTSASTPFVAGIVALMRAMDPGLRWDDVQRILQETSNEADDPRVTHGYVDAYRAVRTLKTNQPPTVELLFPADGATVPYDNIRFRARAFDPEPHARMEDLRVEFTSDRNAFPPCIGQIRYEASGPVFECNTAFDFGFNDSHDVRVTVYDPHDGIAVQQATVFTANTPPNITIVDPADGATVLDDRPIELAAYPQDNEEHPFPDDQVTWESDLDGDLGAGWKVTPTLSQGTHVITATATDETGATTTDRINLKVISGLGVPTGVITQPDMTNTNPDSGSLAVPGEIVTLAATATDPEDGALPDAAFEWYSDHDGFLGAGRTIHVMLSGPAKPCNPEYRVHNITVVIKDSDGNTIVLRARVSVGVVC